MKIKAKNIKYIECDRELDFSATLSNVISNEKEKPLKAHYIINVKNLNDEIVENTIQNLKNIIDVSEKNGIKPFIALKTNTDNFSSQEWKNILKIKKVLDNDYKEFYIAKENMFFSLNEVEVANYKINQSINKIKSLNLSPLEQLIKAFRIVTNKSYLEMDEKGKNELSRNLFAVLNSPYIVCVGYSKWLSAILNGLDSDIKSIETYEIYEGSEKSYHCKNIIYLKDEKYGIEGYFFSDPCFCAVDINLKRNLNLLHQFLVPVSDQKFSFCNSIGFDNSAAQYFYDKTKILYDDKKIDREEKLKNFFEFIKADKDYFNRDKLLKFIKFNYNKKMADFKREMENIYNESLSILNIKSEKYLSVKTCYELFKKMDNVFITKTEKPFEFYEWLLDFVDKRAKTKTQNFSLFKVKDALLSWKNHSQKAFVETKQVIKELQDDFYNNAASLMCMENKNPTYIDVKKALKKVLETEGLNGKELNDKAENIFSKSYNVLKYQYDLRKSKNYLSTYVPSIIIQEKVKQKKERKILEAISKISVNNTDNYASK